MTITELKRECEKRGVPTTGTKADIECRLTEFIRAQRTEQATMEVTAQSVTTNVAENSGTEFTPANADGERTVGSPPGPHNPTPSAPSDSHPNLVDLNATLYATNTTQVALEQLNIIRQSTADHSANSNIEARLSTLETCLSRYFDDQRRIAESIRRIESNMSSTRLERAEPQTPRPLTHEHTHIREEYGDRIGRSSIPAPPEYSHLHSTGRVPDLNQHTLGRTPTREIGDAQRQTHTYDNWYDVNRSAHTERDYRHDRSVHFAGPYNTDRTPLTTSYFID